MGRKVSTRLSSSPTVDFQQATAMVFKLTIGLLALAATVTAANVKRVVCPSGKHATANAACCVFFDLADFLVTDKFDGQCAEDGKRPT